MKRALLAGCAAVTVWIMAGPTARAVDQDAVNKAIEEGVAYLHQRNVLSGVVTQPTGATALVGLTLLECDAKADDPDVRHAAEVVRTAAPTMHETYSLSLSILFLDRLGDPADEPLLQSMAVRLMGGQGPDGGWSYGCPELPESEVRRLTSIVQHPEQVVAPDKPKDPDAKPVKPTVKDLPREIQEQVGRLNSTPTLAVDAQRLGGSDNSNTQFATLGLWVARRHGLPVEKALARIDQRFRATQGADGGWKYTSLPGGTTETSVGGTLAGGSSGSMTCAGLIGLAVARGPKAEAAAENGKTFDLSADLALKKGLAGLGTAIGAPVGKDGVGGKSYYFFWSLERVGVILDQDKIGGHDWYAWGSEILVANQGGDGSWHGEYPPAVDTCFALLFLKRSNVARDLTSALKGKTAELGMVTLKGGGDLGGDPLKGVEPPKDKPKPDDGPLTQVKPPADETEGGRMARELAQAPAERRDALVQQYRDGKGVTYTEALAGAIPQLNGEDKRKARDALSERLTRMKAEVLARYLQDPDAEIRRAAALAAAMKEAKTLIPDLIPLLSDAEPSVAHAAHAALKDLSGEKLGPTEDEWKAWWKNRDR